MLPEALGEGGGPGGEADTVVEVRGEDEQAVVDGHLALVQPLLRECHHAVGGLGAVARALTSPHSGASLRWSRSAVATAATAGPTRGRMKPTAQVSAPSEARGGATKVDRKSQS